MSVMALPTGSGGQCQCNKKTCQDLVVEGELSLVLDCSRTGMIVVDPGPVAPHQDCQMVTPVKLLTQSKQATTKGKAVSHPTT